ncbi:MAG: amidohydrolase [Deltaproteobacteria bacterium]|nr:amidohydrolase [Deltaproteobacteria bacterium]
MKRIDFEAHFATEGFMKLMFENKGYPRCRVDEQTQNRYLSYADEVELKLVDRIHDGLLDLGAGRLAKMDEAGVDVQILSLTAPGFEQFEASKATAMARETNDLLADVIRKHPDRFKGFAALAPQNPEEAAAELERCVKELGFVGWNTHSNYGNSYLDDKKYWPILEKAAELETLIYLHPTIPAIPQLWKYGFALAGAPFGFGFEAAMCTVRLILSGVFDRYPKLKIMLGHYGEALPFLLTRIDWAFERPVELTGRPELEKKPSEYFKDNMCVTTSGNFFEPAFTCSAQAIGIDNIFLGSDFPYETMLESVRFLDNLPISEEDKNKLYHENASRFGITV